MSEKELETSPEKSHALAQKLFFEGFRSEKILSKLQEFGINNVTRATLDRWRKVEHWEEARSKSRTELSRVLAEQEAQNYQQQLLQHIEAYEKVIKKSTEALDSSIGFDDALDAARALSIGIKGVAQLKNTALAAKFVVDVLTAVKEEVKDGAVLQQIGARLQRLYEEYDQSHRTV